MWAYASFKPKGLSLEGCVREYYKSYPGTLPKSLSYWVEMVL
jgi:hypothetical protein